MRSPSPRLPVRTELPAARAITRRHRVALSCVAVLSWLASVAASPGPLDEVGRVFAALRTGPRRSERREIVAAARTADRLAAGGEQAAYRLAGDLYLLAYRAHREAEDLTTAIDRFEHAARAEGEAGCEATQAVAATYAEFGRAVTGYLAYHRLGRRCVEGPPKLAADRALAILSAFRPDAAALAAVERDPAAPLPPVVAPASASAGGADAGPPPRDAGRAGPDASAAAREARKSGPTRMIIRYSDGGR